MVKIIYADIDGGVFTASKALHSALNKSAIESELLNMSDLGGSLCFKIIYTLKLIRNSPKSTIFILQHFDAVFLGLFLRKFGFNRFVNVIHTDLVAYYRCSSYLKKVILKLIFFYIKSDLIVFVSKEAELKARRFFGLKNTKAIYNICDFNGFPPGKKKIYYDGKVRLGTVSRLSKTKNIDLVILVFSELRKRNLDLELNVFGDGSIDEHKALFNLVERLGISDFVHFHGSVRDKSKIFSSIDALISFSSLEGFGMSIVESIYFGVPVFHTDCSSGPREIMSPCSSISDKTRMYEKINVGYLVKPIHKDKSYENFLVGHEKEYIDMLEDFIEDLRRGVFTMDYSFFRFSERHVISQWCDLFGRL